MPQYALMKAALMRIFLSIFIYNSKRLQLSKYLQLRSRDARRSLKQMQIRFIRHLGNTYKDTFSVVGCPQSKSRAWSEWFENEQVLLIFLISVSFITQLTGKFNKLLSAHIMWLRVRLVRVCLYSKQPDFNVPRPKTIPCKSVNNWRPVHY